MVGSRMLADGRAVAVLLRWLGPWTDASATPTNLTRTEVEIRPGYRAWLYAPTRAPHGAYVIAPGLHFDGPADARVDRFCSVLAAAGFVVLAPFLPDYVALRIAPGVIDDFAEAFEWFAASDLPVREPGIFSISFGSLPALRLASDRRTSERISHLVCFGGFADLAATLEFSMTGENRDTLNQPAAFINLLPHIEGVPEGQRPLIAAWQQYIRATWSRPEMLAADRNTPIAEAIAAKLDDRLRHIFFVGTGHRPGGIELSRPALEKMADEATKLDPRPHLGGVRRPVTIVHGRDDDVISVHQAPMLAAAFPAGANVEVVLTGLYDHSRPKADFRRLVGEGKSMAKILRAIALGNRKQKAKT